MSVAKPDLDWRCGKATARSFGALGLIALGMSACGPPAPYVRYQGGSFQRKAKPADEIEVFRAELPASSRFDDLGTVIVTCPSETESSGLGTAWQVGGCTYDWALWTAKQRAATAGGDGLHAISSSVNGAGKVVSLTASVFVYLPQRAPAPSAPAQGNVEERLEHLEKLRTDHLITPEEYQKKRAEILDDL